MNRPTYTATVTDADTGDVIGTTTTHAWNSAIRATEKIVREHARSEGRMYDGFRPSVTGKPAEPGTIYTRNWQGGWLLTATVKAA